MQAIVILLLVWGVLLLLQWLLFAWWFRSVCAALVALFVASALDSPVDALRPVVDVAQHMARPHGQAAIVGALVLCAATTAVVLVLGLTLAVKGRVAVQGDDWHFLSDDDPARYTPVGQPDARGGMIRWTKVGLYWSREVLLRDNPAPAWVLVSVAASAVGAVAAYYAIVAALIVAYERRGLSRARILIETNHTQILFWILLIGAVCATIWAARRQVAAVHVVSVVYGDRDYVLSTWREGLGRAAVALYTHPTPQGVQPVAPVGARADGNAPALAEMLSIDTTARPGWTCRGLLIAPPPAGWPPDRQSPSYAAACAAWYARLVSCVDQGHFDTLPSASEVAGAPAEPNRIEREMRKAIQHDGLPAEFDRGVAWAEQPARADDYYYWPDAMVRMRADLLLIDMEIDGRDHARPNKAVSDERRDAFFVGHGWYTARLWMKTADPTHWQRDLVRDLRRLIRIHRDACLNARGHVDGGPAVVGGARFP